VGGVHRPAHGDKAGSVVLSDRVWLKVTGMVISAIVFLGCFSLATSAYARTLETSIAASAEARRRVMHANAIRMLSMGAELESHLAQDVEWERQEQQFAERAQELEEAMRLRVSDAFYQGFKAFSDAAQGAADGPGEKKRIKSTAEEWRKTIFERIDAQIEAYGDEMSDLNQRYMTKTKDEARRSRSRSKAIGRALRTVAQTARETMARVDGSPGDAAPSQEDDDLGKKIEHFFDRAADFSVAHMKEVWMPKAVEKELRMMRDDFERQSPQQVIERTQALLFPKGLRANDPMHADPTSRYGVQPYVGGSVEAYLDQILFGSDFMATEWPALEQMQDDWEAGRLEGIDVLERLIQKVADRKVPPAWLMDSVENPGLAPYRPDDA
jgi:hypothetical protein